MGVVGGGGKGKAKRKPFSRSVARSTGVFIAGYFYSSCYHSLVCFKYFSSLTNTCPCRL